MSLLGDLLHPLDPRRCPFCGWPDVPCQCVTPLPVAPALPCEACKGSGVCMCVRPGREVIC